MIDIEEEILDKGLTAPRVTSDQIKELIVSEQYHVFPNSTFMVCLLTLKNGFNVSGVSACASPENFNVEIGRKISRENAEKEIWVLEGYLLKQKLHES